MAAKGRSKVRKAKRARRAPMMIQDTCNTYTGMGSVDANGGYMSFYINAAHLLSMMNRKAFHQVTSDGHVINYGLSIQVFNMTNGSTQVFTAPSGYPMENAVRAWHFARKERYADAGFKLSDLGYGNRLRFALDSTMAGLNQSTSVLMIKPSHLAHSVDDKGEFDFSDIIITPPIRTGAGAQSIEASDLTDTFVLHLCGDHTLDTDDSETTQYSKVGMIQSWNENTRGWSPAVAATTIQIENPLAFARASDLSSEVLTTEVQDEQKQSPPYSNVEGTDNLSVFAELVNNGNIETAFPNPTTNSDLIIAPGGLAKIQITNNHSVGQIPFINIRIVEL